MPFRGRKPSQTFDITTLPRLELAAGPVSVAIHHLAEEAHTHAFVAIFGKVMSDNERVFRDCELVAVEAKHPVEAPLGIPVSFAALAPKCTELARALYMSRNDEVTLSFRCGTVVRKLLVGFDDPYFSWA